MKNIKQKVLLTSLTSAVLATGISIYQINNVTLADELNLITKLSSAWFLGLFSVASFFIGLVYPKDS